MHAVSHSLSHRGPSATRARARWQPYSSVTLPTTASTPTCTSPVSYLHTPASSVSSSPPSTLQLHLICEPERPRAPPLPNLSRPHPPRDAQKARYAIRLVDQAIWSLCDTWRPEDIPRVFRLPSSAADPVASQREVQPRASTSTSGTGRNVQLPSPVSPSTHPSPSLPEICEAPSQQADENHLFPIKGFVHEVLRRSRTSTGVLQTALCYLEAVRAKVPSLLQRERSKASVIESVGQEGSVGTKHSDMCAIDNSKQFAVSATVTREDRPIAILDADRILRSQDSSTDQPCAATTSAESPSLPPLPPLPSPLLCPRRTFLACLILASKFMQDRSYSNRAWAKLAGLSPREIGRCERALGDALEWRLWVGKNLNVGARNGNGRKPVSRSYSDGDLLAKPTVNAFMMSPPSSTYAAGERRLMSSATSREALAVPTPAQTPRIASGGLRRCATEPMIVMDAPIAPLSMTGEVFSEPMPIRESIELVNQKQMLPRLAPGAAPREDVSPSTYTPTLCYSPMSTSSASSDSSDTRTIQMTTFTDIPNPSPVPYPSAPFLAGPDHVTIIQPDSLYTTMHESKQMHAYSFQASGPMLAAFNPAVAGFAPPNLPSLSDALLGSL